MPKINNPHDHYFRSSMSDLRVAKEFFQTHLPESILSIIDLNALRLQKASFVDENLRELMADMLYAVNFNQELGYLYVLVEHQSPDRLMAFRLRRYIFRIMSEHLKKKKTTTLPIVIPLVFYNGKKPYPYSTDVFDLFGEHKALARETLLQPFHLIDVTQIPDEDLKKLQWAGVMEFVQKHIFDKDFIPILKELAPLLRNLEVINEKDYLFSTMTYIFETNVADTKEAAKIIRQSMSKSTGEELMTWAEQLKNEGFQEGLFEGEMKGHDRGRFEGMLEGKLEGKQEGKLEGKLEEKQNIAKKLLQQGIDVNLIVAVTGLMPEELEQLVP